MRGKNSTQQGGWMLTVRNCLAAQRCHWYSSDAALLAPVRGANSGAVFVL
jgi:hypothetical protein